jgi:hypothetical protein
LGWHPGSQTELYGVGQRIVLGAGLIVERHIISLAKSSGTSAPKYCSEKPLVRPGPSGFQTSTDRFGRPGVIDLPWRNPAHGPTEGRPSGTLRGRRSRRGKGTEGPSCSRRRSSRDASGAGTRSRTPAIAPHDHDRQIENRGVIVVSHLGDLGSPAHVLPGT